jgi:hypothetical protein
MMKRRVKNFDTLPNIHKRQGVFLAECVESTPLNINDQLYILSFERAAKQSFGKAWVLHHLNSIKVIVRHEWPYGLGCAFIEDNKLYIFGTSDWDRKKRNHVAMMSVNIEPISSSEANSLENPLDMTTVSETVIALQASDDQTIFNTSVCADPEGYVMAFETAENNVKNFSIRFAKSKDLIHWEEVGNLFSPDYYAACPSIRYWNGMYYMLYLRTLKDGYVTFIARSSDLTNFDEFSGNEKLGPNVQVISPKNAIDEGNNNSDIDLVEYHGWTVFVYADGDQRSWANLRTAVYLGTMGQLFEEFWPK